MGNRTENTAVNRLIEQAHERPLEADDALFSSPPPSARKALPPPFRSRIPSSTQTHLTAAPPVAAAVEDDDLPITVEEAMAPRVVAPPVVAPPPPPPPVLDTAQWYEESLQAERVDQLPEPGLRRRGGRARTMLWLSAAFAAGLVATAIVAWPGASVVTTAPPPAAAIVAPPPEAEPVAAPAPVAAVEPPAVVEPAVVAPVVTNVVIESEPSGATVMLVDASGARPIGVTPLPHPIESTEPFEIMVTLAGHRSTVVTVDPAASKRVSIELAASVAAVEPVAPVEAVAPVAEEPKPARKAAVVAKVARKPAPRVASSVPAPARPTGGGTLGIGAKPPCDIFIDGKKTGLKTPQRAIKVSPGPHRITLVNREHKITETFTVDVKAGSPTKIVKDLTSRMK